MISFRVRKKKVMRGEKMTMMERDETRLELGGGNFVYTQSIGIHVMV